MKETVAAEFNSVQVTAPPNAGEALDFALAVAARSQIVWGEHCTECAYPKCYVACSFYDPRPDLHCRRFVAGIEAVRDAHGQSLRRIRFRQWGKLEGRGPAPLRGASEAARREKIDAAVSSALAQAPLPFAAKRSAVWRWNAHKARGGRHDGPAADAFVVEGWSNDGLPHDFTLTFLQDSPRRAMFQAHFRLGATYARLATPAAAIAAEIDLDSPYLVQIEPVGEAAGVDVVFGLTDFVAVKDKAALVKIAPVASAPVATTGASPLAKVLVWDLDETLWSGTLAEDGAEAVHPRPDVVEAIRELDRRGVLQSVASKNDHDEAMTALRRHGLDEYFLHPRISWGPKSQSIAEIAAALDLGIDSIVFIDDQPFERAEVQARHPSVRVLDHLAVTNLLANPWFDHPVTPEAGLRRKHYQSEASRTAAYEVAGTDYLGFLRGSGLVLEVAPLTRAQVVRVFELSQRTNQLNFTGAKFTQAAVERMAETEPGHERLILRCSDRFGDYGLIGFADVDLDTGEIMNFFMSCRVQRKRVEHAFFGYLARALRARAHSTLTVRFRATERNGAAVRMLEDLGFQQGPPAPDCGSVWSRSLLHDFADSDVVRIAAPAAQAA